MISRSFTSPFRLISTHKPFLCPQFRLLSLLSHHHHQPKQQSTFLRATSFRLPYIYGLFSRYTPGLKFIYLRFVFYEPLYISLQWPSTWAERRPFKCIPWMNKEDFWSRSDIFIIHLIFSLSNPLLSGWMLMCVYVLGSRHCCCHHHPFHTGKCDRKVEREREK